MTCLCFVLLSLPLCMVLFPISTLADVSCDGIDDDLTSNLILSNFITASTGSLVLVYVPMGTIGTGTQHECYFGQNLISDASGNYVGLYRNGNYGGAADQLCAYNWDGTDAGIPVAYTTNVRTHLAWVHSAGTLLFYKDGVFVGSLASGNTESLAASLRLCSPDTGLSIPAEGRFIEAKTYAVGLTAAQIASEGTSAVHNVIPVAATGRWNFDDCTVGASANGVTFLDRSGNARPITGSSGANGTGASCLGSSIPYAWGVW